MSFNHSILGFNAGESYFSGPVLTNSNSNWTFIALNLPKQEDSKAQQNKSSQQNFCIQGHKRGQAPRKTPGE